MLLVMPAMLMVLLVVIWSRSLDPLLRLTFRQKFLAAAALALQLAALGADRGLVGLSTGQLACVLAMSNALLLAFVFANRRVSGMKIIGVGLVLNVAVMAVNHGYMPVTADTLQRSGQHLCFLGEAEEWPVTKGKSIILERDETRLWYLSDVLVPPTPLPVRNPLSAGDIVLACGLALVVAGAVKLGDGGAALKRTVGAQKAACA